LLTQQGFFLFVRKGLIKRIAKPVLLGRFYCDSFTRSNLNGWARYIRFRYIPLTVYNSEVEEIEDRRLKVAPLIL